MTAKKGLLVMLKLFLTNLVLLIYVLLEIATT